jgi:hypothetical protein
MPTPIRSAVLAAAFALCACGTPAEPTPQPQADPPAGAGRSCNGSSDLTCGAGSYCRVTAPGAGGVCTKRPQMCPMIYQPVCGEDGKTYPNTCHAGRVGVNVVHGGACGK